MQLQALSIRLMSTLTLFEILKFNEPIRSLTISGSFCANLSREGEDVKKEEVKRRKQRGYALCGTVNGPPYSLEVSTDQKLYVRWPTFRLNILDARNRFVVRLLYEIFQLMRSIMHYLESTHKYSLDHFSILF